MTLKVMSVEDMLLVGSPILNRLKERGQINWNHFFLKVKMGLCKANTSTEIKIKITVALTTIQAYRYNLAFLLLDLLPQPKLNNLHYNREIYNI